MFPFYDAPAVVGHRGAPHVAPENTPAAFLAAWEAGARWVELDVRRSADDVPVVHHDPTTPDGTPLIEQTAHDLSSLGVWGLEAVLADLPDGLGVDVEIKNNPGEVDYQENDQRTVELVTELLEGRIDERPWMTSSFNPLTVSAIAKALPSVPAGLLHLGTLSLAQAANFGVEYGAQIICPPIDADGLAPAEVAALHAEGLAVFVWTVDDLDEVLRLVRLGVDAICTNRPGEVVKALADLAAG
ncbi:glycerophosphodiester phosphodiesterase [Egibacter rhizosphaerae]|uniref:Glycerophosphodiester phosphodiesterase n=1 Tax=Egibacter rhizosphaerae TaxID=1670831 RepID=A0A411YD85_9ACTN|nr:glycerophosphodiester phosphodiesterase [Egibacter rhizosphaerae]QBI19181.1 glycerophosphodiester phosphodiesterase [Egibacter rhizosphaerae]